MSNKLTVVIVTRQRLAKLKRCLESISKQTELPDKVLVIDNDEDKSAKSTALAFGKVLNLSYTFEPKPGVAYARNKALKACKTPLLGFVDDDCVLDKNWVKVGINSMTGTKTAYILGKSLLFNRRNLIALAQYYHQNFWFNQKLKENKGKPTPFNFDTKNVVLNLKDLKNQNLRFDPNFTVDGIDSSDTDFGFRLENSRLEGTYEPKMVVRHEEIENPLHFLRKGYKRGKLAFMLANKWNLKGEFVDLQLIKWTRFIKSARLWRNEFHKYTGKYKTGWLAKVISFLLIKVYERAYLKGYLDQAKRKGIIKSCY